MWKNIQFIVIVILLLFFVGCQKSLEIEQVDPLVAIELHLENMISTLDHSIFNPRCTNDDGSLRLVKSKDWTSGFFPGILWMQYEYTKEEKWRTLAEEYSSNIEDQQYNAKTHDMGFKMYSSYGNAYRLTNSSECKKVLMQSAQTLMSRYNPKVGCIRSWDHNADTWDYPVIIDNMLNLELLFSAFKESRDSAYYKVAYSHAMTTLKNHFRDDNSCYHVISYNPQTGEVEKKNTHQGISDDSAWARGQAWALYGFTMAYRETQEPLFLKQAEKVARYIITHPRLPEDGVPYWDFDDPNIPNSPRDASAAAIILSALYELALYSDQPIIEPYAEALMETLSSSDYFATPGTNNNFFLKHSTGNYPKNDEIDQPIIYADYYYMEALLRRIKFQRGFDHENKLVLKLDDLKTDKDNQLPTRWLRLMDYAIAKELPVNIGIIAESLAIGSDKYINELRKYQTSKYIEYWNHGYYHKRTVKDDHVVTEFYNTTVDQQINTIHVAQKLAAEKLGKAFTAFGSPYNQNDENTEKALLLFPEIITWFYPNRKYLNDSYIVNLPRVCSLNVEYPTHSPHFYDLINNMYFHKEQETIVLQGHPQSWDDDDFMIFQNMIDFLLMRGYEFYTSSNL